MSQKIVAIIPARKGSKGLKNKNMLQLGGLPLIHHSLQVALEAKLISHVVFTSDCIDMIDYAKSLNKKIICIKRPEHLASDVASSEDVVDHALSMLADEKIFPSIIILLQPTCPFRSVDLVNQALLDFIESGSGSLVTVSEPMQHPSDFVYFDARKEHYCYLSRTEGVARRQDFDDFLFINGNMYITKVDWFKETQKIYDLTEATVFPTCKLSSIDIDDLFDLQIARALWEIRHEIN